MQNAADPRYKVAGREPKIGVWDVTGHVSSESVSSPCPVRPPTGYQKCPQSVAGPISVSPFPLRYLKGDRASKTESYKDSLVSTYRHSIKNFVILPPANPPNKAAADKSLINLSLLVIEISLQQVQSMYGVRGSCTQTMSQVFPNMVDKRAMKEQIINIFLICSTQNTEVKSVVVLLHKIVPSKHCPIQYQSKECSDLQYCLKLATPPFDGSIFRHETFH